MGGSWPSPSAAPALPPPSSWRQTSWDPQDMGPQDRNPLSARRSAPRPPEHNCLQGLSLTLESLQCYHSQCHPNTQPCSLPESGPELRAGAGVCPRGDFGNYSSQQGARLLETTEGCGGGGNGISSLARLQWGHQHLGPGVAAVAFHSGSGGIMATCVTQSYPREAKTRASS